MTSAKDFDLTEIIYRSLVIQTKDVDPLVQFLGLEQDGLSFAKGDLSSTANQIAISMRKSGSNDIATLLRGGDGVEYPEIVFDVGKKLGARGVSLKNHVVENESLVMQKLFADTLGKMSDEEKRQLFSSMGLKATDFPFAATGTILVQALLTQFGTLASYQMSLVLGNILSWALLDRGLTFAANVALTRVIGTLAGPIGWAASGIWLLVELAGPAYRRTVPAVVYISMLRQLLMNRVNIGVVGDGSAGKDSLIRAVFGVDTGGVHPVAGYTSSATIYKLDNAGSVHLVNYPGFNDFRPDVRDHVDDMLPYTDVFLMVVDLMRGVSGTDVKILDQLRAFGKPVLVCLNKIDLPRPRDKAPLLDAARERLTSVQVLETAFDPDPRLGALKPIHCKEVHEWVVKHIAGTGKETSYISKSEFV